MDAGSKERLRDLDVAEPGEQRLIEEGDLHRPPCLGQPAEELRHGGRIGEGVGAELSLLRRPELGRAPELDGPEHPRVSKGDHLPVVELERQALVRKGRVSASATVEPPAHPEVEGEAAIAGQDEEEVLSAALDALQRAALDEEVEALRGHAAKHPGGHPRSTEERARPNPLEQAPARGLDLRELGHVSPPSGSA
jgi:hypothetical protein